MFKNIFLVIIIFCSGTVYSQSMSQTAWQQRVDYTIDVKLDDVAHMLNGNIVMKYTNNSPSTLKEIYIHLWPNAYKTDTTAFSNQMEENGDLDFFYSKPIDRGYIDGLKFTGDGTLLKIEPTKDIDVIKLVLAKPLETGKEVVLSSPFRVKIPKVFSRLGHEEQNYFITQWYPKPAVYDVNGWNPMPYLNLGEFYSEFGSFNVKITLPKNYTIVATGECQTQGELSDSKSGLKDSSVVSSVKTKTIEFTADKVHDFAWFASKNWGYVTRTIKIGDKEILARVVGPKPRKIDLEHIETAISYYSENVGVYPYSHATVVHGELKAGGGMEYPMITLCDFMSEEVIVHEVGHNWFYGILANNERRYPWMDESINSYYEAEAMKKANPHVGDKNGDIMTAFVKDNLLRNEHQAIATSSELLTKGNYGMSVYGIGASSIGHLKAFLGAEVFKKCMTTYYDTWKFKHPLPNDMRQSFESTSGKNLGWFFEEMLSANGKLDYTVCKHKKGFEIKNVGTYEAPVPVEISHNGVKNTEWVTVKPGLSLIIEDASDDRKAIIDPKNETIDLHKSNNASKNDVKLKLGSGRDRVGMSKIYVVPTLGWNAYDKMMVGLGLHNYSVGNKPVQWHVFPMYSFEKKSINGVAEINYTKPFKGKGQYSESGVKAASFDFKERGFGKEYKYFKISPYFQYYFPKSSLRSTKSKSIRVQYDQVFLSPNFEFNDDTLSGPATLRSKARSFVTATYSLENKRAINGYSLEANLEYGNISNRVVLGDLTNRQIRYIYHDTVTVGPDTVYYFPKIGEETDAKDFMKLSGVFKYNVDIGIKNKPLELRFFGSYILKDNNNTVYRNTIGSTDRGGYYDYKFDDYLMHRNADYGMFRNQISNNRDFSKFVGLIGSADQWLFSANITVPLPGKFPIKPFAEITTFNDIKKAGFNTSSAGFIYNIGIEIEVIPNRFEIFLNLAQSSDVTTYQENSSSGIDKFAERITFVLDLNNITPHRLKKHMKLF